VALSAIQSLLSRGGFQGRWEQILAIGDKATLASARACKGLRVICIGPGDEQPEPTRPDHRAHSLLDAARFIETSAAFS